MILEGRVGPITGQDGSILTSRLGKSGEQSVGDAHGRNYEAASRQQLFVAANQAATVWSAALATTHTGLVLSNPANSGKNVVLLQAGFVLTVAPAAIASIGLFGGYLAAGLTAHTTPLVPISTFINQDIATGVCKADAAATLVGTPRWLMHLMGGFTAAALPATSPALIDIAGSIVVPPGGYVGIGALTAVTGMGSLLWEEVPV